MDRNSTINGILKAAGKESEHQEIRFVYEIDGIDCYGPTDDPNTITYVFTCDTAELKKQTENELNVRDRESRRNKLEEAVRIKNEWLRK